MFKVLAKTAKFCQFPKISFSRNIEEMAIKKTAPKVHDHYELGELILSWRSEKFRSALALFKETKFSFSYYSYVDFEKGSLLPTVGQLLELAKFFKQDAKNAVLIWAKCQMPNAELKSVFELAHTSLSAGQRPAEVKASEDEAATLPPMLENTWVFNEADRKLLLKWPTHWELCLKLALRFPRVVRFNELGFASQKEFENFCEKSLGPWMEQGRIVGNETGLRLALPHLHLPKSEPWHEVRNGNVQRAANALLENLTPNSLKEQTAYRGLLNRNLSPKLMKKWVTKLQKLEEEILAESYDADPTERLKTCSLLMLFGERKLKVKS